VILFGICVGIVVGIAVPKNLHPFITFAALVFAFLILRWWDA